MGKRLVDLMIKLTSIKGLFFLSMLVLALMGRVEGTYLFYTGFLVIGDRTVEKLISNVSKFKQIR